MLAPVRITAPSALPVSVPEAKAWARIDHSSEDAVIETMIQAATNMLDGYSGVLGMCILSQTWRVSQRDWTWQIRLPFPNVNGVSVSYFDASNVEQTISASFYELIVDSRGAIVRFKDDFTDPSVYDDRSDAVRVAVTSGYANAGAVPSEIKSAIMMLVANWFEDREATGTMTPGVAALLAPIRSQRI